MIDDFWFSLFAFRFALSLLIFFLSFLSLLFLTLTVGLTNILTRAHTRSFRLLPFRGSWAPPNSFGFARRSKRGDRGSGECGCGKIITEVCETPEKWVYVSEKAVCAFRRCSFSCTRALPTPFRHTHTRVLTCALTSPPQRRWLQKQDRRITFRG